MSNAIMRRGGLTPQTLDEAIRLAEVLAKSTIVPKDYQGNPGNVLVAIQWGQELGLAPLQAMQNIAVINGRPSVWGDAMLAIVRGSGLLESIEEVADDAKAVCTVQRRGEQPVTRTFGLEDAKRAGLLGKAGPWTQYQRRMMQMRARAWALRDVFPDVLRGVHIAEEAMDIPPERDMGSAEVLRPDKPARGVSALKGRILPAEQTVARLPEALAAIDAAATIDDLEATANLCAGLEDEAKKQAREAYARKRQMLTAPVKVDDDFIRDYEEAEDD